LRPNPRSRRRGSAGARRAAGATAKLESSPFGAGGFRGRKAGAISQAVAVTAVSGVLRSQTDFVDELGFALRFDELPRRIISLVPSLTETLFALGLEQEIVGVTDYCVAPSDLVAPLPKVGGTKNPNLDAILGLEPDLVIANAEENRRQHVEWLRARGVAVYVTYPRSVAGALETILSLGKIAGREARASLLARKIISGVSAIEAQLGIWNKLSFRVFCPIWKRPWITFNADTYAHDVLRLVGFKNVFGAATERYPRAKLEQALELRPDVILLPDEPYAFDSSDIEELKQALPAMLARRVVPISGRDLHWYGAHMASGLTSLAALLNRVRASLV
jgi:ABC-type Fe3+-hydroxamate transport system substrate-binding protein